MLRLVVVALLVGAVLAISDPVPANGTSAPVPSFSVNLDLPAELRWVALAAQFKDNINFVIDYVVDQFPADLIPYLTAVLNDLDLYIGSPWKEEMMGVASGAGVELGDIVLMNLYYEITAYCTSIVAMHENGTIYHGRNLDYGIPGLQNTTTQINFVKDGKVLYRGITFVGYVGLLTGVRPGAFSASVDERDNGTAWDNLFEALFEHGKPIGFTIRTGMETAASFDDAVKLFSTQHLIASVYIIVGGVKYNEGAVITRERQSTLNLWLLDYPQQWFLVETNYDHWLPPPANDNRSGPAIAMMAQSSPQTVDGSYIFTVLNTFPMLNDETMYTASMSAALDQLSAVSQNNL